MPRDLTLLGVPTSAGAFAPGQELAPAALREAGLIEALGDRGVAVDDQGDLEPWRWRPDRSSPRAQNRDAVTSIARRTAERVGRARERGAPLLVLGGDCTVELGTVAGHADADGSIGLVYFDVHPDLNTPASVHEGAFDWMGVAHMLAVEGADPALAGVGPRTPLLDDRALLLFGWDVEHATPFERDLIERRGLDQVPLNAVAADPERAAAAALDRFAAPFDRLLVHFDVDTVDFTDAPLSENTGRNEGLPLDDALVALRVLLSSPKLGALTVTELNPLHGEPDGATLRRFVAGLAGAIAA